MTYLELYAPAVRGVRQRRPITRRAITSSRSTARQAPVLWRFDSGAAAFGIFVDAERCWVGNQRGDVVECLREGERLRVRVASPGYEAWNVQFPKDIREAGARYLVEGVRPSGRGGFYRAYGEIRRLL